MEIVDLLPVQTLVTTVLAPPDTISWAIATLSNELREGGGWVIQDIQYGPYEHIYESQRTGRRFKIIGWRPVTDAPMQKEYSFYAKKDSRMDPAEPSSGETAPRGQVPGSYLG